MARIDGRKSLAPRRQDAKHLNWIRAMRPYSTFLFRLRIMCVVLGDLASWREKTEIVRVRAQSTPQDSGGQKLFFQAFTAALQRFTLAPFDVRWWSAALGFGRRRTGNPAKFRDGPAAVIEQHSPTISP
jgi:hypothetical protein